MPVKHDHIHKRLIQAFPADFVRLIAPRIAARIELDAVAFRPEEHHMDGRERRLDLVSIVPTRLDPADEVALNVEVELKYRGLVRPKLFNYNQVLERDHELPAHTLVMFLRGGPPGAIYAVWHRRSLDLPIYSFHYHSLGLSRCPPEELLSRPEPLAWALSALTRPRSPTKRAQARMTALRLIAQDRNLDEDRRFLLFNCVQTYVELDSGMRREYQALLDRHVNQEVQEMITTWSEKVAAEAHAAGVDEGRQEGRQKGRQEERETQLQKLRGRVGRLAGKRFGKRSASLRKCLSQITSPDELMDLMERVMTVNSPDELGLATRA